MLNDTFIVESDQVGVRLDVFLTNRLEGVTRSAVLRLIENAAVLVNGEAVKAGYKTRVGDSIFINLPECGEPEALPEDIPLDVVFEDSDIIVVNKPQGMVVHPAAGHYSGTLVNALLHRCAGSLSGINGVLRPGIVHRIDKDTSGLIVVAKNDAAHQALAAQLAERTMKRTYVAVAVGNFKVDDGTINKPIARDPKDRKKMGIHPNGREAVTHYTVLERFNGYTLIEARLETGRTHQIRVHMASINRPLLGDVVYGAEKQPYGLCGQILHATAIGFIHPNGKYMVFEAPPPQRFGEVLEKLRNIRMCFSKE